MAKEYEFALLTQSVKIPAAAELEKVDFGEAIGVGLGPQPKVLANSVKSFQGGGWEVVSHDLTVHGNILIITYLLRRPQ